MSICRREEFKCPKCSSRAEVVIWDSLNSQIDPKAREDLLRGDLHTFKCPQCKVVIGIEKSFLYHEMERDFMVWFYPFKSLGDPEFFNEFSDDGNLDCTMGLIDTDTQDYAKNVHYVFSMDELVRYIRFREKLADIKNPPIKVKYAE